MKNDKRKRINMYSSSKKLIRSLGDKADLILSGVNKCHLREILSDSSAIIDSYLCTITSLPLQKQNALLDSVCIALSKAEIYRRYASNDIPKDVSEQESKAYDTLEKIQQKKIFVVADEANSDSKYRVSRQYFDTDLS